MFFLGLKAPECKASALALQQKFLYKLNSILHDNTIGEI